MLRSPIFLSVATMVLLVSSSPAQEAKLTPEEQATLLKRLTVLQDEADQVASGRLASAVAAYKTALGGNEATIDLYLQCIEKVRYADQNRPLIEFREWKRQQKDKFGELSFREALRYQLRWLLIGLEMAEKELQPADMSEKAAEVVASVTRDAKPLGPHLALLREDAFGTVFAHAFRVGHLAPEGWPSSPLPVGPVYEQLILPRLRQNGDLKRLEAAWTTRINQETTLMTTAAEADQEKGQADLDRFMTEKRPQLLWNMLTDIYKAGGQRQSAGKMLAFLEANVSHRSATDWAGEMKELLEGPDAPMSNPPLPVPPSQSPSEAPAAVVEGTMEGPRTTPPQPASSPEAPPPPPSPNADPFDALNQPG